MAIDHRSLHVRYCKWIFFKREKYYLNAIDRDQFLKVVSAPIAEFLVSSTQDSYFRELIEIYSLGHQFRESEDELLRKAEKCREKWAGQDFMGTEYNQPYIPVDEIVHKKHPRYISKFIVQVWTAQFFSQVLARLDKARKRGGLREREEMKILSEAKQHGIRPVAGADNEIGFKWIGVSIKLRIETLYQRLRKGGFIDRQTSLKQFNEIFSGEPVTQPVVWINTNKLLLYFTDRLMDYQLVKMPQELEDYLLRKRKETAANKADGLKHTLSSWQYARIAACFISKDNKPYAAQKLKHQRNELDNKNGQPPGGALINQMVKEIASLRDPNE